MFFVKHLRLPCRVRTPPLTSILDTRLTQTHSVAGSTFTRTPVYDLSLQSSTKFLPFHHIVFSVFAFQVQIRALAHQNSKDCVYSTSCENVAAFGFVLFTLFWTKEHCSRRAGHVLTVQADELAN